MNERILRKKPLLNVKLFMITVIAGEKRANALSDDAIYFYDAYSTFSRIRRTQEIYWKFLRTVNGIQRDSRPVFRPILPFSASFRRYHEFLFIEFPRGKCKLSGRRPTKDVTAIEEERV